MIGNNSTVAASSKSISINTSVGKNLSASSLNLTPEKTNIKYTKYENDIESNESYSDKNLVYEEFSLEELMVSGEKAYEKRREELLKAEASANEFDKKINSIDQINSQEELDAILSEYNLLSYDEKQYIDKETKIKLDALQADWEERNAKRIEGEKRQNKIEQLDELYTARTSNNEFNNPIIEATIEYQILKLEQELGVPHKPASWEKFYDVAKTVSAYGGTFGLSAVEGFVNQVEGVFDGFVYAISKIGQLFGGDDKWAENVIAYDVSSKMYDKIIYLSGIDGMIQVDGIDPKIAYGPTKDIGNFAGEMAGYYALSAIPYVGIALCTIGGAGTATEESINRQIANNVEVNDWGCFWRIIFWALEGFGFGKAASGVRAGVNAVKKIGVSGLKETGKQVVKNTTVTSLKQALKPAAIKTLTDADLYVETASVLGDDIVSGLSTGEWNIGRIFLETVGVVFEEYVGNFLGGLVDFSDINKAANSVDVNTKTPDVDVKNVTMNSVVIDGKTYKTNLTDAELDLYGRDRLKYGIPADSKYLAKDVNGSLIIDWNTHAPNRGAVEGTRTRTTIPKGAQFDRYGNPEGNFFAKMEYVDGNYQSIDYPSRSLPYVEGSQTYTKYTVVDEISTESLSNKISKLDKSDPLYLSIKAQVTGDGFEFIELPDGSVRVEVTEATIAGAFGQPGGGTQYEIPVNAYFLRELGFIKY